MIRRDPKYDPLGFVDEAVKRWRPEAFKERPFLASVEYKVSMMGIGALIAALVALMFGMAFVGLVKAVALALLVLIAVRAAKPLVRARLYDIEEAKQAAKKAGQERQDEASGRKADGGPTDAGSDVTR